MPKSQAEGSGLTLHFDKLSVLSLPKEAVPSSLTAVERVNIQDPNPAFY